MTSRFALAVPPPFELPLVLTGHGWYDLAPYQWEPAERRFTTVVCNGARALDVTVVDGRGGSADRASAARPAALQIRWAGTDLEPGDGGPADRSANRADDREIVRAALRRMLRLDHDYAPFWARCAARPTVAWAARRGGGRLLASATLFEDLLKILFTTNCSWAATALMARRLCDALGPRAPSGRAGFPEAARCAAEPDSFWREVVRAGYRGRAARALAERFAADPGGAERDLTDAPLPTPEVRRRLLTLDGFGAYAVGQALRLLGRHDDLALDSWCRARLRELHGARRPPTDRAVERRYRCHGEDRGLVLWLELTADWHGERSVATGMPWPVRRARQRTAAR